MHCQKDCKILIPNLFYMLLYMNLIWLLQYIREWYHWGYIYIIRNTLRNMSHLKVSFRYLRLGELLIKNSSCTILADKSCDSGRVVLWKELITSSKIKIHEERFTCTNMLVHSTPVVWVSCLIFKSPYHWSYHSSAKNDNNLIRNSSVFVRYIWCNEIC